MPAVEGFAKRLDDAGGQKNNADRRYDLGGLEEDRFADREFEEVKTASRGLPQAAGPKPSPPS